MLNDLENWGESIEKTAKSLGLDFYPQEFEIINHNDMIACEAYMGMPSRYPHWSFGKAYEKIKTLYSYNLAGLPYEMVINSNPCMAYLMKDNTLLLQILTIAHVYGHNDFFKNSRLFKGGTDAGYTGEMFKNHADIIRGYLKDPSIGYENVEKILDAAHALKLQAPREVGARKEEESALKERIIEDYRKRASRNSILVPYNEVEPPDFTRIPLRPEDDLLYFITQYGELSEWEKNILDIVREEAKYFIPQIETKIMNEGWASFWHYKILKKLDLKPSLHMEFIKRHNDVIAPVKGYINPYYLGFEIFSDLYEKFGQEKIFEVRAVDRDQSFIRRYLTHELCQKLNLFQFIRNDNDLKISEVSDEEGWKKIRSTLCDTAGMGMVPCIRILDMSKKDKTLTLEHVFDGRELNAVYAKETLKSMVALWGHKIVLKTTLGGKDTTITCDENKLIVTF